MDYNIRLDTFLFQSFSIHRFTVPWFLMFCFIHTLISLPKISDDDSSCLLARCYLKHEVHNRDFCHLSPYICLSVHHLTLWTRYWLQFLSKLGNNLYGHKISVKVEKGCQTVNTRVIALYIVRNAVHMYYLLNIIESTVFWVVLTKLHCLFMDTSLSQVW